MSVRQRKFVGELPTSTSRRRIDEDEIQPSAGWDVFCKIIVLVFVILPTLALLSIVFLIPTQIDPTDNYHGLPESPPALEGPYEPNDDLVYKGSRMLEGQIYGPESLVYQEGHLYTGTADGDILHIDLSTKQTEVVVRLGEPPCGAHNHEDRCGRPLGMRFDADGYLIVLDAYLGMYKVNIATREFHQMLPGNLIVDGKRFNFLNDLAISRDGAIYFTDSSRFRRRQFHLDLLEGRGHGRLLKHDPVANTTEVLLKGLYFANGVELSRDESYLLVAETTRFRIQKYHLTGEKAGKAEMFIENMPGTVDNIRRSYGGGYWAVLGTCRHADKFDLHRSLSDRPWLRKQLAKMPLSLFTTFLPPCGMIVELDRHGNVIRTLQDLFGERLSYMSEVEDHQGILYIGSFTSPYIGYVNTDKKRV